VPRSATGWPPSTAERASLLPRSSWSPGGRFAEGWHRLELHIDPANAASCRVAEKAGFVLEGVLRGYELIKERRADVAMYARLAG